MAMVRINMAEGYNSKYGNIYSHLNQDGENKSSHPSCCYRSPKHKVNEAAHIKYVRYGYGDIEYKIYSDAK